MKAGESWTLEQSKSAASGLRFRHCHTSTFLARRASAHTISPSTVLLEEVDLSQASMELVKYRTRTRSIPLRCWGTPHAIRYMSRKGTVHEPMPKINLAHL